MYGCTPRIIYEWCLVYYCVNINACELLEYWTLTGRRLRRNTTKAKQGESLPYSFVELGLPVMRAVYAQ